MTTPGEQPLQDALSRMAEVRRAGDEIRTAKGLVEEIKADVVAALWRYQETRDIRVIDKPLFEELSRRMTRYLEAHEAMAALGAGRTEPEVKAAMALDSEHLDETRRLRDTIETALFNLPDE